MPQVDQQYKKVLREIMQHGYEEVNQRTGHKIKALPGVTFEITDGFPLLSLRKIPYKIFIAEQIWFLTGNRKPEIFLNKYTKIWDDFTNIDGVVTSAYGYRWRHHFGRDQIADLVKALKNDPSSRQCVVVTWDQSDDGLVSRKKANVPCPYSFVVNIIGGKLNLHNIVRSNDMILGFPHDMGGFALLQRILAKHLKVGVGKLTYSISHAHIYDIHYEAARALIKAKPTQTPFELDLPEDVFDRAEEGDEKLVEEIVAQIQSFYVPLPPIKNLNIVL